MARSIGSLTLDLIARTGSFDQGMDRASRRVRTTANEMEAARRAADRMVAGIAAAAAGFATAAAAMAVSSAKSIDATSKMAQQIGTTTESLTGMRFAAQQFANISDQQFDMSMRRMTRRIAEAAEGSGSAKNALESMGLSARELARLAPEQQMLAIADAMQKTERQADRLRYTMALFDTEGMALVPALQQGAEAFEANIALARQFGVVVSQEAATAAEEFMTNMNLLTEAQKGFKNQVAEAVLPTLADLSGRFVEIARNAGDMGERVATALKVIGAAAAATATIITSRLVAAIVAKVGAWGAATIAAARLQAQMASLSAAIAGASRVVSASAATAAAAATTLGRAGQLTLAVLGGPAGLAAAAAITGAAFLTMGRNARDASVDIDELANSFRELTAQQLELRLFDLGDEVRNLEEQARESGQILRGMEADALALADAQGVTADELENVRRSLLEQREAHQENTVALDRARALYGEVSTHLQRLQDAANGAAGGVEALNQAMHSEAGEKYLAQLQGQIKALQDGGDPIKIATRHLQENTEATEADRVAIMSAAHALKALQEARAAATRTTSASTKALTDAQRAAQNFRREQEQSLRSQLQAVSAIHQQAQALEDQIAVYGLGRTALEDLTIARLEEQAAMLRGFDGSQEQVEAIEREIEARQRLRTAIGSLEQKEAERQAWEDWARDVEQIFNRVGQSLTDAIFDGGKSGKDLLRDLFKGLTFNILINPVMNQMQGWVTNQLGGMFGVQNPQQGGGILGLAQNANMAYQAYSGGMASNLGQGISWLGQKIGSDALTSFATGLTGAAGAAGTVAGITSIGASLGASLGTSIGTSTAAMASTTFSASLAGGTGAAMGATAGASGASALGAGLGAALPWVGGALAVGSLLGGLFGDDKPTTRRSQRGASHMLPDGTFEVATWDDRQTEASQKAARDFAEQAVKSANELFSKAGVDAAIVGFSTLMESSILGDKQGVGSSGYLQIGEDVRLVGLDYTQSSWTRDGFGGWSEAEMLPRLQTDIQLTLLEAFQAAGDAMPNVLAEMLEGIDIRSLGAEQAQALAQSFQIVIDQVTGFQIAVERLPFANLRDLSFDASANLISFAGGLENLDAGMTSYFQHFHTEAEQLEWAAERMGAAFADVGLEMPDITQGAEAAKWAYRELRESLDLTTEEGQRMSAMLFMNAQGFHELVTGLDQLNNAVVETARTAADIARERENLERQLLQIEGDTVELRRRDLLLIDESNRSLQELIWTRLDEIDAAAEAARVIEEAQQRAAAIAQERYGLETQLLQLLGDTDALRARQLATLDESNHAIQRQIWAEQDLTQARTDAERAARDAAAEQKRIWDAAVATGESAYRALSTAIGAERDRIRNEADRIAESLRNAITSASDAVSNLESLTSSLSSTIDSMVRSGLDESRNRAWAQERISRALSVATLTGIMPSGEDFESALQIVAQPSEGLFSSFEDYQADFLRTAHEINSINDLADEQLTAERKILLGLEAQLDQSQAWADAEMARLDETLEYWRDQLDIGLGTYQATLSVADAVRGVQGAIANLHTAMFPVIDEAASGQAPIILPVEVLPGGGSVTDIWESVADRAARRRRTGMLRDAIVPEASYAVGTPYVPRDMIARIHEGEAVIDRGSMDVLRRYGINVQGGGNTAALERKVEALQREQERTNRLLEAIAANSKRSADGTARMSEGEAQLTVRVEGPVGTVLMEDWTAEA